MCKAVQAHTRFDTLVARQYSLCCSKTPLNFDSLNTIRVVSLLCLSMMFIEAECVTGNVLAAAVPAGVLACMSGVLLASGQLSQVCSNHLHWSSAALHHQILAIA